MEKLIFIYLDSHCRTMLRTSLHLTNAKLLNFIRIVRTILLPHENTHQQFLCTTSSKVAKFSRRDARAFLISGNIAFAFSHPIISPHPNFQLRIWAVDIKSCNDVCIKAAYSRQVLDLPTPPLNKPVGVATHRFNSRLAGCWPREQNCFKCSRSALGRKTYSSVSSSVHSNATKWGRSGEKRLDVKTKAGKCLWRIMKADCWK